MSPVLNTSPASSSSNLGGTRFSVSDASCLKVGSTVLANLNCFDTWCVVCLVVQCQCLVMPCPVLSFFPSSDRASPVRSAAFETSSKLPVRGKPLMCTTAFFKLNAVVDIVLPCPVFHGRTESEMRIGRRQSGDAEDGLQLIQLSCGRTQHSSFSCQPRLPKVWGIGA